jgi:GcrA cell cycle regulator
LRKIWLERKLSASQIAGEFGVSRNAILGKVFRLGLIGTRKASRHPTAQIKAKAPRRPAWNPPKPDPIIVDETPDAPEFLCLGLLELTPKQCHYPHGDGVPYAFCGQPVRDGSSYCGYHHALAYYPVSPSRRASVAYWARP